MTENNCVTVCDTTVSIVRIILIVGVDQRRDEIDLCLTNVAHNVHVINRSFTEVFNNQQENLSWKILVIRWF